MEEEAMYKNDDDGIGMGSSSRAATGRNAISFGWSLAKSIQSKRLE
jgi:hypothetical protein